VKALILKIEWDPATVDKDGLLCAAAIKMSVEWSHDIYTLLAVAHFLNLSLTSVIENATDLDGLHGPCLLELLGCATIIGPNELGLVSRRDVGGLLGKHLSTTGGFLPLLLTTAVLILSCLMDEHCRGQLHRFRPLDGNLPRAGAVKALNTIFFAYMLICVSFSYFNIN